MSETTPKLTADMTRMLPGHVLDDASYSNVEDALDRVQAPCSGPNGRWLKLHERVLALAAELGRQPR